MNELSERYAPISLAVVASLLLLWFQADVVNGVKSKTLDFTVLYAAVFDWSAIQTGFLFGIFGYIAGKNDGFIAEIKATKEMKLFSGYQKTAIFLGFTLTFISIPLMVTSFNIGDGQKWKFIAFCAWAFLSIWAFFSFVRVAYIFGVIIRVKDTKRYRG